MAANGFRKEVIARQAKIRTPLDPRESASICGSTPSCLSAFVPGSELFRLVSTFAGLIFFAVSLGLTRHRVHLLPTDVSWTLRVSSCVHVSAASVRSADQLSPRPVRSVLNWFRLRTVLSFLLALRSLFRISCFGFRAFGRGCGSKQIHPCPACPPALDAWTGPGFGSSHEFPRISRHSGDHHAQTPLSR